ncbi:MAG: ATP-binding protein [Pseudohongiellaceae bacterium]
MTIADLYPYLILVGGTIMLATAWLLWQARRRAHITSQLVSLNESLSFDLPDFLRKCWKPLSQAGFKGINWQLSWFGTTLSNSEGVEGNVFIQRKLEVEEISLVVNLYDGPRRFEQRYFSTILSESFFLLLHMDMWIKLGTVQGAFAQTAKLTVFLQHDMKNLVQLISLVAEQLEAPAQGNEEKLLISLRAVMPSLMDRSERFLNTLSSQVHQGQRRLVDLGDAIHKTAKIYDLSVTLSGSAQTFINELTLNSILDNLIGNYADQSRIGTEVTPEVQVRLEDLEDHVEVAIKDSNGAPCLWPERLFEPFWSDKGTGLGIGLYHARQQVMAAGGSLRALAPSEEPLTFILSLPKNL